MILGYETWTWDESIVEVNEECNDCDDYPCEFEYKDYFEHAMDILFMLSQELNETHNWEYGYAEGHVGWLNHWGQTQIKEVDKNFLYYMVFETIGDSDITATLDFTTVDAGIILLKRSHHDRPMGEKIFIKVHDSTHDNELIS